MEEWPPMDNQPNSPDHELTTPITRAGGPATIPPAAGGPAGRARPSRPKKTSTGRIIGLAAAGLVAVVVILLVGSELWFRHSVSSCLSTNIKQATGGDASVSLSKEPTLIQYFSGTAPSLDINVDNLNNTPGLSARLHLTDVKVSGDNRIGSATIQGSMTADGILARVKSVPLIGDPKVVLDSQAGTIDITGTMLFAPLELTLKPELTDNKLQLAASKVQVMGFGVPDDLAQQVIDAVSGQLPTPKGLTASNLAVTSQAVSVTYSGTNVIPADLSTGNNAVSGNCSFL